MTILPVHPRTGLTALGIGKRGPIWPVKGGSEDGGEGAGGAESGQGEGPPEGEKHEVDWKAKSREWERKAKANAGAAQRLAEIEEANKTEAQKAAERLAKAEQTAKDAEARVLRREVALEHKLGKDDAALLDSIIDEDAMRALAARLAGGRQQRNHVPREGSNPKPPATDEREFVRNLFGSGG